MRRADRLFRLVQLLSPKRDVTARMLAEKLEVSERTIYRDMQDLSLSGIPVISEAGRGYRLMPGFQLPPLMFDEEEITSLLLGVRMTKAWADKDLANAADRVLEKISAVLPDHMHSALAQEEILVPDFNNRERTPFLRGLREAINNHQTIMMCYQREDGLESSRQVQPLGLFYWGSKWTFVGWCELRDDYRHFRLDRIQQLEPLNQHFVTSKDKSLKDYLGKVRCDHTNHRQ